MSDVKMREPVTIEDVFDRVKGTLCDADRWAVDQMTAYINKELLDPESERLTFTRDEVVGHMVALECGFGPIGRTVDELYDYTVLRFMAKGWGVKMNGDDFTFEAPKSDALQVLLLREIRDALRDLDMDAIREAARVARRRGS